MTGRETSPLLGLKASDWPCSHKRKKCSWSVAVHQRTLTSDCGTYGLATSAITLIYVVGLVIIWFAPETKGKPLPE